MIIMKTCNNCGTELEDAAKFCRNCGAEVAMDETATKFCSNCGFEMPVATRFCPECGNATDAAPAAPGGNAGRAVVMSDKSSGLAAILSFFIIGLGLIYLGLNKKGIILFLAAVVSGFLMLFVIGFILWFIIWVYAIYDAYNSGEKMRNGIAVADEIDFNNLF